MSDLGAEVLPRGQWGSGAEVVRASVGSSVELWRAFAGARGHRVVDDPAWFVVDAGPDVGGTRVILRRRFAGATELAALDRLIAGATGPVVVEDPFGTDLHAPGRVPLELSVMGAGPFTLAAIPTGAHPEVVVRSVSGQISRLLDAERIVVESFPLTTYQPYLPGQMLPASLLTMPHISVFVAELRGTAAGALMTVKDAHGVGGIYWVAVLPAQRRAGVGRALMLAAMTELAGMPMVLSATTLGAPLYRKLGFEPAQASTFWQTGIHRPIQSVDAPSGAS